MDGFLTTTYLSEILEKSDKNPVIVFKYSSDCNSSEILMLKLQKYMKEKLKKLEVPVYKVTVQDYPVLSRKIEELFQIKHETPQIIIINKGKITYSEHHSAIEIKDFKLK